MSEFRYIATRLCILWSTRLHPPEVSGAPPASVFLHLWYQHSMAPLMPKIWNEGKNENTENISRTTTTNINLIHITALSLTPLKGKRLIWLSCWPVGCIILRSAGNVLRIICKIILLDFGLQIFGFGSARTWTWPVTAFAVQLLFLRFLARGGSGIRVLPGLQKALVPFLVLPVSEDLQGGAEGKLLMVTTKGSIRFHADSSQKAWCFTIISRRGCSQTSRTCLCSSRARRRRLAEERSVSSSSCRVSSSSMPIPSSSERPSTAVYLGHNFTCSTGLKS